MAPQLHRNCTSERSACSFLEPFPQTNTYCQLAEGAPPHAAKDCAFLRFTASAFPIYALIKKTTSLRCFHSRNRLSKKSRRKRFVPSDTSVSSWDHFAIHSHLLLNRRGSAASNKGFTSNGRLVFSPPPPHGDTPASPNFFYKPNTARKPKTYTYKSPYRNDKNSFLLFTKAIMLPGQAILPQRWTGFPSQPTPISKGIESLRATANTAYPFSSRYKRKRWTAFSRCAKRRIIPA